GRSIMFGRAAVITVERAAAGGTEPFQNRISSSAPPAFRFSRPKRAPWAVRISRTRVRPSARPSRLVLKKGVKRNGRTSSGMPGPVSEIDRTVRSPSRARRRPMRPSSPIDSMAFLSTFTRDQLAVGGLLGGPQLFGELLDHQEAPREAAVEELGARDL